MIQIENLSYRYTRNRPLFNGLDLTLHDGKVYGLLGNNGAGKSSLIKNIAGLLFPTKGSCRVNGFLPMRRETAFLEQMFFIPEECHLPPLSIAAFTEIYAPFYPGFSRQQFRSYLEIFSIDPGAHLSSLSFGQKKKAFISYGLAANTRLLIMDEPTNGLDIPSKMEFRNIVAGMGREDKTIIMSTHQVRDLDDLIHSIIILDEGRLLLFEDKERITQRLHFQLSDRLPDHGDLVYSQLTPNGISIISRNRENIPSYLNIETLFNATLYERARISKIFAAPPQNNTK